MHPVDVHVGKQLKKRRVFLGMTQTNVAATLEISFQQIQKYELGPNRISASKLFELAEMLNVPVSYFFEGLDETGGGGDELDEKTAKLAGQLSRIPDGPLKDSIACMIAAISEPVAA